MDRFEFQRQCVSRTIGKVLNVGCKEDPAHLKSNFGDRVINMDIRDFDHDVFYNTGEKVPIPVDIIYSALNFPYPFIDNEFGLIVLGDILEDLPDNECQLDVLNESYRIGQKLCITTPEDTKERDWHHYTTITEQRLKDWLTSSNWKIVEFNIVDYGFVPRGYLVFCEK